MQDPGSNQPDAVAERPLAAPASEQAELTDMVSERGMYNMALLVGLMIGGMVAGAVLVVFLKSLPFAPVVQKAVIVTAFVAIGSFVWAVILHLRNRGCRRVRHALADSAAADLPSRIERLLPITRSLYPQGLVREAAKTLAGEGRFGATIRIAPRVEAARIDPIAVPFEPQPFDQVAEMESAGPQQADVGPASDGGVQLNRERAARPVAVPRGIRRNLMLKGGWFIFAILGLSWVARAIGSLQRRTVTPQFMLMTVVMLAILLVPVGHDWITGRQWLAVPAGVVVRKGKWLKRR